LFVIIVYRILCKLNAHTIAVDGIIMPGEDEKYFVPTVL